MHTNLHLIPNVSAETLFHIDFLKLFSPLVEYACGHFTLRTQFCMQHTCVMQRFGFLHGDSCTTRHGTCRRVKPPLGIGFQKHVGVVGWCDGAG